MGAKLTLKTLTREKLRAAAYAVCLLMCVSAFGCGAKTGLNKPDVSREPDPDVPEEPRTCIEIPIDGSPIDVDLTIQAEVGRADVTFLIDRTQSMEQEIDTIRARLRDRIAPGVREDIPDSSFAVATFADFPVPPHGAAGDDPFSLVFPLTDDVTRVQTAINAIELGDGGDGPESQVEALYQLATGEGISPYVEPSSGCPGGGFGYACNRPDAVPTVLLFTDDVFHNGPGGSEPYTNVSRTHRYNETVSALVARNMRVIGFDSGTGRATANLRRIADDTQAVDTAGNPLVYSIGQNGAGLSDNVIDALRTFASSAIFDVDTVLSDADPADGVDVRAFVDKVTPKAATPMSGIDRIDEENGAFIGARAGTTLEFTLTLMNDVVVPGDTARTFLLRIVFRGDMTAQLGSELVELVIPGADGSGCPDI